MSDVEKKVLEYLCTNNWAYIKVIYKSVNDKMYGYSLNKFRKLLKQMVMSRSIKYKNNGSLHPYWYVGELND